MSVKYWYICVFVSSFKQEQLTCELLIVYNIILYKEVTDDFTTLLWNITMNNLSDMRPLLYNGVDVDDDDDDAVYAAAAGYGGGGGGGGGG